MAVVLGAITPYRGCARVGGDGGVIVNRAAVSASDRAADTGDGAGGAIETVNLLGGVEVAGSAAVTAAVVEYSGELGLVIDLGIPVQVDLRLVEVVLAFVDETTVLTSVSATPVGLASGVGRIDGRVVLIEAMAGVDTASAEGRGNVCVGEA